MRKLIEQILQEYNLPKRDCITNEDRLEDIIDAFINFGIKVCELQKQECANNAQIDKWESIDYKKGKLHRDVNFNTESILNCKNICDE